PSHAPATIASPVVNLINMPKGRLLCNSALSAMNSVLLLPITSPISASYMATQSSFACPGFSGRWRHASLDAAVLRSPSRKRGHARPLVPRHADGLPPAQWDSPYLSGPDH